MVTKVVNVNKDSIRLQESRSSHLIGGLQIILLISLKLWELINRGYSNFLLNMAFISPSEVENIYIS